MTITPPFVAGVVAGILALIKFGFGVACGSIAVISSALDSLGDLLVSAMNFFALKKSGAKPNSKFNFGYGKIEALATLFEGIFIIAAGLFVAYGGVQKIINPEPIDFSVGAWVMVISIALTALLVIYLRKAASKYDSMIIYTDSVHYEIDLITNAATLGALIAVHYSGLVIIDALFGMGVSAYIVFRAVPLVQDSIYMLLDGSLPPQMTEEIAKIVSNKAEILSTHQMRTRKSANVCFFSAHFVFDPQTTLAAAHEIEEQIESEIRAKFNESKWVFEIHFDVSQDEEDEF